MTNAHRITALVFDGMKLLDLAGPFEVFTEAGRYDLRVVSPDGNTVHTSTGLPVPVAGAALPVAGTALFDGDGDNGARDAAEAERIDTLLVVGGDQLPTQPVDPRLTAAAVALSRRATRTVSVCTGAFVLAAAGLLDGRRATTHWRHARLLAAAYPRVKVESDAIFVRDGDVFSSAGVSAGIDLALALVEEDHGAEVAREVARSLVVFLQRPGGQSQFSPSLAGPRPTTQALRAVTDAIATDPAADHSIAALAARAHLSERHLSRLFRQEVGSTPARYVESVRIDAAMGLLTTGRSVTDVAGHVGFGSPETLRRAFTARVGVSPRAYQQRFASAARDDRPPRIATAAR